MGVEWTDIAAKTLPLKPYVSEATSLIDFDDVIMLQPISNGERLELALIKCHQKIVVIGLGDVFLSIETLSIV